MTAIYEFDSMKEFKTFRPAMQDGELACIAGVDDTMFDAAGRKVKACPLPEGHLQRQLKKIYPSGSYPRLTSTIGTKERAAAEGVTDAEYAAAQMKNLEAARPPKVLKDLTQLRKLAQKEPDGRRARQSKMIDVSSVDGDPLDVLTTEEIEQKVAQMRLGMRMIAQACDWHESLEILPCKLGDSMFCHGAERIMFGIERQGKDIVAELLRLKRSSIDSELDLVREAELVEKRKQYRFQYRMAQMIFRAAKEEREDLVRHSGIQWSAYMSLKERNERSASDWRVRKAERKAELMGLVGMSHPDYRKWLNSQRPYTPRTNGVETQESHTGKKQNAAGDGGE